jgi:UDP-3-O-[3-hydroxymyristoyl] glucosamine N-acyltransferase
VKKEGSVLMGSPALDLSVFYKSYAVFRNLPELRKQLIELDKEIKEFRNKNSKIGS